MRFSPQQVYEIVGISRDTLRHWRKALSPITDRNGYRPCFSLGDALALKVVKVITEEFGIPVGQISRLAPELFKLCGQKSWSLMDEAWLVVNPHRALLQAVTRPSQVNIDDATLWIPIGKLMHELRQTIMHDPEMTAEHQFELALPPGNIKQQT